MKYKSILVLLLLCIVNVGCHAQQSSQPVSTKKIDKWIQQKDWASGLSLNLHVSVNKAAFYEAYHTNKKLWDTAFAFLQTQDLINMPIGKRPLIGETVFISVTD
ncbi:hypothetical protein, partial [Ferruginibacter sp.]|uniref:hypothetical protein n=1 Tax=Ferruginibacter sp. TaxID=1940288 RepID=UPI0019B00ADD